MDEKNESPASPLLVEVMKGQEAKSPDLRAKQQRLLQVLASKRAPPADSTRSDPLGEKSTAN